MRSRIYLDTSVFSALGDVRAPDRQALTQGLFTRLPEFDAFTSEVTRQEIDATPDPARRAAMIALLPLVDQLPLTAEAERLAEKYMFASIFPASVPEDALHVAIATLARMDIVVSWNFKHLVNQRRRAAVNELHRSLGLPSLHILPPPEL